MKFIIASIFICLILTGCNDGNNLRLQKVDREYRFLLWENGYVKGYKRAFEDINNNEILFSDKTYEEVSSIIKKEFDEFDEYCNEELERKSND